MLFGGNIAALLITPESIETTVLTLAYTKPLALSVSVGTRAGGGIVDIAQDGGNETIHVTVPADWQRTEVSGATLEDASATPLSIHWTSWRLPAATRLRFAVPTLPPHAALSLPSALPISLTVTKIDLIAGTTSQSSVLVKDSEAPLW